MLTHFLQYEFIPFQAKQKCCLVLPGYLHKMKKAIDFFTKSSLAKFAKKSKKFAALAEATNISVVFENEKNLKKLFVKAKLI